MFYKVSDGLRDVWDVESYGCWMFGMWNDQAVGCSGCEMFGMLNVLGCRMWNVVCLLGCGVFVYKILILACGMFGMCDVHDVECSGCGMIAMWDVGWLLGCGMLVYKMPIFFNILLTSGVFPSVLKSGKAVATLKNDFKLGFSSYLPISPLSNVDKILAKIM